MSNKENALQSIADIARNNNLTLAEIAAILKAPQQSPEKAAENRLARSLNYIGGTFIFAGIAAFAAVFWNDMGPLGHVILLLGSGFAAFLLGLAALHREKYTRAATPLFLIAACLQPLGLEVMLDEYNITADFRYDLLVISAFMITQQGFTFLATKRTALVFFTLAFFQLFCAALFSLLNVPDELAGAVLGLSTISLAAALDRSPHADIAGFWYLVGACLFLEASWRGLEGTPFETLFLGLAVLVIYASIALKSRALLATGTLSIICFVIYFTQKYFADVLGWPVMLVLCGLMMVGLSSGALKLHQKYLHKKG